MVLFDGHVDVISYRTKAKDWYDYTNVNLRGKEEFEGGAVHSTSWKYSTWWK